MPSDNEKGVAFPEKGAKTQKEHRKKHGRSAGWVIGVIVLILISITFILPVTVFTPGPEGVVFGSYNGEDIELIPSYDNYFFNQLNTLANMYQMNPQNEIQIYSQAFYATTLQTALTQMAKQAGISVTNQMVSEAIVESGAFTDDTGAFSLDEYNAAPQVEKEAIKDQLRYMIPAQKVFQDISTVKTSENELDFVSSLNDSPRSFEYITVDYSIYPDADAVAFAESDPAPFNAMELSVITAATEDEAAAVLASISSGEKTFEEAAADSTDSYAENGGSMGSVLFHNLEDMLVNAEDASAVFSTAEGTVAEPVQGLDGWKVFRADSAPATADLTDPGVLADVKRYISLNDAETMNAYLDAEAQRIYGEASADFTAAADNNGLTISEVGASSYNPAQSSFIIGVSYNDPDTLLASASYSDENFAASLFTTDENTVLEPVKSGSSYIIARPTAAGTTNDLYISYIDSMYSSYTPDIASQDMQTSIFASDGFVNDFFTVFLERILGVSAQ